MRGDKEHERKMYYVRTLMFPLEKAGQFRSKVTNLRAYNTIQPEPTQK